MQCPDCNIEINIDDNLDACDECGYHLTNNYELTKINIINFIDDENKINIKKYISCFNKLDEINREINRIDSLYQKIFALKSYINRTNHFNITSIQKRIEYMKAKDDFIKLMRNDQSDDQYNFNPNRCGTKKEANFRDIHRDVSYLDDDFLHKIYNELFQDTCNDGDIILYKLITFNLEKKFELKTLLQDFYSEENIKLILSGLYEKKINLLETQLII